MTRKSQQSSRRKLATEIYWRIKPLQLAHGPRWRTGAAIALARPTARKYKKFPDQQVCDLIAVHRYELGLAPLDDSLSEFYRLFDQARQLEGEARKRLEIDARILAGMPASEIAAELEIDLELLLTYESCLFDVRYLLPATDAMYCYVIPTAQQDPLRNYVLGVAYSGGIVAVKWVLQRIDLMGREHDLTTHEGRQLEQMELMMQRAQIDIYAQPLTLQQVQSFYELSTATVTEPTSISQLIDAWLLKQLSRILTTDDLTVASTQTTGDNQENAWHVA